MIPFILLLIQLPAPIFPFNVLVYSPSFAASHMNFMAHLADTLTDAGHNVTFLVPVVDEGVRSRLSVTTTKDFVLVERDEIMQNENEFFEGFVEKIWTLETDSPTWGSTFQFFNKLMIASCANLFRNREVLKSLKSKNFDVAILEPISACGLGLFKELGIEKTVLASSVTFYDTVLKNTGEPEEMGWVPGWNSPFSDEMGFLERFRNFQFSKDFNENIEAMFDMETAVYQHQNHLLPTWRELLPAASLFFTNSNSYLDFPRPVLQKTVPIGGIAVDFEKIKNQKLDKTWSSILDKRSLNMIVSFGSHMKSSKMPIQWRDTLLKVMRSEPNVTFIWKYEMDEIKFADRADNIHFSPWIPQSALLNDDRIAAFLTHAGLGSVNELVYCGKPAIMVPIFCDQPRNARMMERHESSIMVLKTDLEDYDTLKNAVSSILYDEKYNKNAKKLAAMIRNQPYRPKELVVKHVEFLARYGPFPQLDPAGRRLNFLQKNLIDVFFVQVLAALILGLFFVRIVRIFLFNKFSGFRTVQKVRHVE